MPATIGRYRVVGRLGQGGMGEVFLGRDDDLARDVALKVPILQNDDDDDFLARFRREARTAATFRHPNFCPIYEVGTDGDRPFLAMAYIEGQPLSSLIDRDRPLDPVAAASLVRRIALAMAEAHDKRVVHRDLKPSNVMIDNRGEPIVMDFGLAWVPTADDSVKTVTGRFFGSAHYASPEQIRGDKSEIGPPTDIYSLGAILYELVTGRRPFEGPAHYALAQVFIAEPPPPSSIRPGLDRRFDAICAKAMRKSPGDRYGSMRAFATALDGVIGSANPRSTRPASTRPVPTNSYSTSPGRTEPQTVRPARRGRNISLTALLAFGPLFLAVALGVVIYVSTNHGILRIEGADDQMTVTIDGREVRIERVGEPIKIRSGEHGLTVTRGDFVVKAPKTFEVMRGQVTVVKVELVQAVPPAVSGGIGRDDAKMVKGVAPPPPPVIVEKPKPDPMPVVVVDPKMPSKTGKEVAPPVDEVGPNQSLDAKQMPSKTGKVVAPPIETEKARPSGTAKVASEALDRGAVLFKVGRFKNAVEAIDASVEAQPTASSLAYRALSRYFLADHNRAIADADRALLFGGDSAMAYLARGLARDELGDSIHGAEDLEKAAELNPDSAAAHGFLACVLVKLKQPERARLTAARSMRIEPRDDLDRLGQAEALIAEREYAKARDILDDILGRSPSYVAYVDRAGAHIGIGDVDKGLADLNTALDLAPTSPIARTFRAQIELDRADPAAAISDLDEAIRAAPQYGLAHGYRGRARIDRSDFDEGFADLREAVRLGAREAFIFERLGYSHNRKNESDSAIEALDQSLALDPTMSGALYERGVAHERKGNHDRAIRDFNSTLELKPGYTNALHWRAICKTEATDYDGAIVDFDAVLAQEAANTSALVGRARARIAKMQFDGAIEDCDNAIRADKKCAPAFDYRAIARDAKGESVGAQADRDAAKAIREEAEAPPTKKI